MDIRCTGRAMVAVAGSPDTDPSDCLRSCSSAVAVALTLAVVDTPATAFQPADGTAGERHHTDWGRTAAVGCTAPLNTHNYTLFSSSVTEEKQRLSLLSNIDFYDISMTKKMKIHDLSAKQIFRSKRYSTYECIPELVVTVPAVSTVSHYSSYFASLLHNCSVQL